MPVGDGLVHQRPQPLGGHGAHGATNAGLPGPGRYTDAVMCGHSQRRRAHGAMGPVLSAARRQVSMEPFEAAATADVALIVRVESIQLTLHQQS